MIAIILNFLRNHWLGSLVSLFAIGVVAKLSIDRVEINHLHNQIAQYRAENVTLEKSNTALVRSIGYQNAAIAALHAEADRKMKTAAYALAAAKINARKYMLAAEKLKAARTTSDECADMRLLVNNYISNAP